MGQKVAYQIQPRLNIYVFLSANIASYVVLKLMCVPSGPTFTVRPAEDGAFHLWTSKRTYNALKAILAEAKERGEF